VDRVCGVANRQDSENDIPAEARLPSGLLCVVLGATASGKTELAVALAKRIGGEIISVDSRQVYRRMDIGTGKDLEAYQDVPRHLVDICEPGERYNVSRFRTDFHQAYRDVLERGRRPIACGGTGLYLHSLLQAQPYVDVPVDLVLREKLQKLSKEELCQIVENRNFPSDFQVDRSVHRRLVRAVEVSTYLENHPDWKPENPKHYPHVIFGIDPPVAERRGNISRRLEERVRRGLVDEVQSLLANGLTHEDLQYYGLEYKYVSLFLSGKIGQKTFFDRLETEIHRYAKRQMTFFRKMEKDGIQIHWLRSETTAGRLEEVLSHIHSNPKYGSIFSRKSTRRA